MPELDRYRKHGWWRDETFLDDLRRFAGETPDRPALISHRDGEDRIVSYAELARLTESCAVRLAELGVGPGDVVTVQLPNWWELLPLGLACARIGAIFCPLMIIYRRRELDFALRLTEGHAAAEAALTQALKLLATLDPGAATVIASAQASATGSGAGPVRP